MITIESVAGEAFRSFRDRQQITNLAPSGFFGVRGKNLNTGGSSGAGKSSFFHLIAYPLGFSPFAATKQQSWLTKTPMYAELVLRTPEGLVELRKGHKPYLKVGDKVIKDRVEAIDRELEAIFGIPLDLLKTLTYRPQRKPGLFLSLTDDKKKQFLSRILGLDALRDEIKDSVKRGNQLWNEAAAKRAAVEALREGVPDGPMAPVTPETFEIGGQEFRVADIEPTLELLAKDLEAAKKALEEIVTEEREFRERRRIETTKGKEDIATRCQEFDLQIKAIHDRDFPPLKDWRQEPGYLELLSARRRAEDALAEFQRLSTDTQKKIDIKRRLMEDYRVQLGAKTGVQEKLDKAIKDLLAIKDQTCPTCRQQWTTADIPAFESRIADLGEKLKSFGEIEKAVMEARMGIEKLQSDLRDNDKTEVWNVAVANIDAALRDADEIGLQAKIDYDQRKATAVNGLKEERYRYYNKASAEQVEMYARVQEELDGYQRRIQVRRDKVISIEYQISMIEDAKAKLESEFRLQKGIYENAVKARDAALKKLGDAEQLLGTAEGLANEEADYSLMLKGFLGAIFEEILVEISAEANMMLRELPNVATTTIRFQSSEDGPIVPVVVKNGHEIDIEANLSGGQLTGLELAVDLAISKVLKRRTGSSPGWLIFDESFTGFDAPVIESCLQLLARAGHDLQIFIVDHSAELRDYFSKIIEIQSQDDVSEIVA